MSDLPRPKINYLALRVLTAFVLTFSAARILVFLIMDKIIPDFYFYVGSTHVHHLNYGIFLLAAVGAYFIFTRPSPGAMSIVAIIYGIGLALTFDEFGMWLHLGGGYWQRASFDAVTVVAAILILLAFSPSLKHWRVGHYLSGVMITVVIIIFFIMLFRSLNRMENRFVPKMQQLEANSFVK
jgi:hypothetical protein